MDYEFFIFLVYSWVEEDPLEILQSVKTCIEKALINLKALNISSDNIKCKLSKHSIKCKLSKHHKYDLEVIENVNSSE